MKNKITFAFITLVLLFSFVLVKAVYVQIINSSKLIAYSNSQVVRTKKVFPKRGQILDRNLSPLAINVKKYNVFTFGKDPAQTLDSLKRLKKMGFHIGLNKAKKTLYSRRNKFSYIARKVSLSPKHLAYIEKNPSLHAEEQFARLYPNNELAAQLIGFVGLDNEGLGGIENYFNSQLKGKARINKYFKDAKGRPIKFQSDLSPQNAKNIVLSIDKDIQSALETYLKEGVEAAGALKGGAGVMNAETGEILAVANYPSYDPNRYGRYKASSRRLAFVTDPFEPGSTFKTLTIATAIDNDVVKLDTNYYCEKGKYKVQNHYITESDAGHDYEWLTVKEILQNSSNIGTTKIAFDLGYPSLKKGLKKFHIGEKLGVQIKGESRGILESKEEIPALRLSNISFGQGVATTGIQMLASYAAIANGGYYVQPSFLKTSKPRKRERILKDETVESLNEMLLAAVDDGTGGNAKVKYFKVAGKTSTAQRIDENGRYNGYIAGFVGYPLNVDNKFVVYVYVEKPVGDYYGNKVAAPIFQKITRSILYKDKNYSRLARKDGRPSHTDKINLVASAVKRTKKGEMPNFEGMDKRTAKSVLDRLGLDYNIEGFGIVYDQFPLPGTAVSKEVKVRLKFKAPDYE